MNYRLKTMEGMDACVFSSDMLYNDEERKHFKAMVERWARALNETENVAPPQQPEQEPVAWMHNFIDDVVIAHRPVDLDRHPDRWTALYKDPTPCQTCESLARTVMMDQTSHDTPQREWQGLTDEEWRRVMEAEEIKGGIPVKFARAIEAKLKEKNT